MHSERGETLFANLRKSQMIKVCSYCSPNFQAPKDKFATHGICDKHQIEFLKGIKK